METKHVLLVHILLFAACHAHYRRGNKGSDSDTGTEVDRSRYVDLTHAFNNDTAVWPGRKLTFFTEFEHFDKNGVWVASRGFCTSEHTATHIDAPYHFNPQGRRLHEIPFEDLINVEGVMINIYDKVHEFKNGQLTTNDNYGLTREDVLEWEQKHGKIPQGAVVLLRTGWDALWGDPRRFRGEKFDSHGVPIATPPSTTPAESGSEDQANKPDKMFYDDKDAWLSAQLSFPAFGESAAKFLAVERAVRGVGVDVISIDPGNQNVMSPAHRAFASRNIFMLEMVANLHHLPPRGFQLWMLPFKIDRGTGAPTRVVARLNE